GETSSSVAAHMSFMKHSSSARCFAAGTAHSRQSFLEVWPKRQTGGGGAESRHGFETMLLGRAA
ncbi:MAG: hypothetical protein KF876_16735, partial [Nitrospira sp.]|nr:hypothetical protein [Nitrospira sp.]